MPQISVILPVYNGGEYLKYSVESVLQQINADFELIIVDDCSTDGSNQYLQSLNDNRIRLFTNTSNKGLFWNLNFLISNANSSLIKLWAQDDIMYPECLASFINFYNNHPEVGFMYSMVHNIDVNGLIKKSEKVDITPEIISTDLHAQISFEYGSIAGNISNTCIVRKALDKVGLFNEQMLISADFEMWVRIAQYFPVGFIKLPVIKLRDHDKQLSRNEKYYINHVSEDLCVYDILHSYVSNDISNWGRMKLREKKYMFYYTLFVKSFLKGRIFVALEYIKSISRHENFFLLTFLFFKKKLFHINH
jgi:glycosyltransferase involved in cell wall biosynthesis